MFRRIFLMGFLVVSCASAEVPDVFEGLFQEDIPVKGSIGVVMPPPEIEKYLAKVEAAAREDPEWFNEFSTRAKPGIPLPYDEKIGLTEEEYAEYLELWRKREFKPSKDVILVLNKTFDDMWTLTTSGDAASIATLRFDPKGGTFRSPNGEMKRLDDIDADPESILGAWTGKEWRFEEETGLGKVKENFAIGKMGATGFGLVIYRAQEISTEGRPLMDKSLVIRFPLGKAGHYQVPAGTPRR